MNMPSGDELEAVKRLAARPEGHMFLGYLQQAMSDTGKRLMYEHDAVVVRVLQGNAQVLDILLKAWKP